MIYLIEFCRIEILKKYKERVQNNKRNGSVEITLDERLTAKKIKYEIESNKLSSLFLLNNKDSLNKTKAVRKWTISEGNLIMNSELPNKRVNSPIIQAINGGLE